MQITVYIPHFIVSQWWRLNGRCPDCGEPVRYYGYYEEKSHCISCNWPHDSRPEIPKTQSNNNKSSD